MNDSIRLIKCMASIIENIQQNEIYKDLLNEARAHIDKTENRPPYADIREALMRAAAEQGVNIPIHASYAIEESIIDAIALKNPLTIALPSAPINNNTT